MKFTATVSRLLPLSVPQTTLPMIQSYALQTFWMVRNNNGDKYVSNEIVNASGKKKT
jgi:hypothetical protein